MNEQTRKAWPVAGDFETLKETAQSMIDNKDSIVGLNPHKVKRLCEEFEQLKASSEINGPIRARAITSLSRLIADARHRFDDCRDNLDNGSEGGYGDSLTEDIGLLAELKKGMSPEVRHHDEDTLAAAYNKGFGDAKIIILREVQKLGKCE